LVAGPRPSKFVEGGQDVMCLDVAGPSLGPLQPFGERRSRSDPCDLASQQLRNRHLQFGRLSGERRVHLIVEVSDLDGLRHNCILTCKIASPIGGSGHEGVDHAVIDGVGRSAEPEGSRLSRAVRRR